MVDGENRIREEINELVAKLIRKRQASAKGGRVRYSGAVFDEKEIQAIVQTALDGWFGLGAKCRSFESQMASFLGVADAVFVNSGSSANLLAVTSLTAFEMPKPIKPGDEVITPACTFPTTLNPQIQNGLKPVLLDVNPETYNINAESLEKAYSKKTRLVMLPHTLGNPNEMDAVMDFAEEKGLYVIEDNCDGFGSEYGGRKTGSFGIMSTLSLYPAHHMTTGEGGMVFINENSLSRIVRSYRDWGRACWCASDEKNPLGACGVRFNFNVNGAGYDHKYMYSHVGYNLKPLEMQAAMGLEQIKKLPGFIKKRKENFRIYEQELSGLEDQFILPKSLPKSNPCWFAFPLTIRSRGKIKRAEIVDFLEKNGIDTRPLFSGNIVHQQAYKKVKFRIAEPLDNSDRIMLDSFFVGIYPGLGEEEVKFVCGKIREFCARKR